MLIAGVSLNLADRIIARKQVTTTLLIAAALAVTAGLTVWVVGYTLRPLRRLAGIAAEVAAMPLTDDDHRISVRVRPRDTNQQNEVGIVGHTLNRLLDNVDSALAQRAESDLRMRQFITDASHELRPRWRRFRDTPNSPGRTVRRCRRPPNTRWPASSPKRGA